MKCAKKVVKLVQTKHFCISESQQNTIVSRYIQTYAGGNVYKTAIDLPTLLTSLQWKLYNSFLDVLRNLNKYLLVFTTFYVQTS